MRVTRSEVSRLIDSGRVEETIYFSPGDEMCLTYALMSDATVTSVQVRYTGREIAVVLPQDQALTWAAKEQVGIYATVDLGINGALELIVEKDFACLEPRDADNSDAFPNPKSSR